MKYSHRPWVGCGREGLPEKGKKQDRLEILQIAIFGQNRVPDRDFEALRGAESMKFFLRILERDRGDGMTHNEVLS